MVFQLQRRGVCQDFAHLVIACLRSLGLAARYVSGYLLTRPPPGRPKLVGADASHAWISVWMPEHGWLDFDPTNEQFEPRDEHVSVAYGRDYSDVTPLRGVVVGPAARQELTVAVDVARVDDPRARRAPPDRRSLDRYVVDADPGEAGHRHASPRLAHDVPVEPVGDVRERQPGGRVAPRQLTAGAVVPERPRRDGAAEAPGSASSRRRRPGSARGCGWPGCRSTDRGGGCGRSR